MSLYVVIYKSIVHLVMLQLKWLIKHRAAVSADLEEPTCPQRSGFANKASDTIDKVRWIPLEEKVSLRQSR